MIAHERLSHFRIRHETVLAAVIPTIFLSDLVWFMSNVNTTRLNRGTGRSSSGSGPLNLL